MTAAYNDFIIESGSTWSVTLSASDVSGSVINHTGYSVSMDIRNSPDSTSSLLSLTQANGRVAINGSGSIVLSLASSDTSALTFRTGVYDLKVATAGGNTSYYLRGKVNIIKSVTP